MLSEIAGALANIAKEVDSKAGDIRNKFEDNSEWLSKEEIDKKFNDLFCDDYTDGQLEKQDDGNEHALNPKDVEKKKFEDVMPIDIQGLFDRIFREDYEDTSALENCGSDVSSKKLDNMDDVDENKELSSDETNEKQKAAIKEGLIKLLNGELTDAEKGNLCEIMMDQYYISIGYKPIGKERLTSLDQKGHQGLDGVYESTNGSEPKYIIADAKFGQSPIGTNKDGTRQMSDAWIDKNLDKAVGKEKADEIRESYADNPSSVGRQVFHVESSSTETGKVSCDVHNMDVNGFSCRDREVVQVYDSDGVNSNLVSGDNKNNNQEV